MNTLLRNKLLVIGGIAVGAITGALTAPKSGKETRDDIQKKIDELQSKIKDFSGEARVQIEKQVSLLKESLKEVNSQFSS